MRTTGYKSENVKFNYSVTQLIITDYERSEVLVTNFYVLFWFILVLNRLH